jgi:hypothetical protein
VAATVGCATAGDRRRRWWFTVAGGAVFLLSLSPLFFVLFSASFFSSFGLPLLFSLFSLLFYALSFLFPPISFVLSPVFIGKTGEIEARGGHYAIAPKTARGTQLPLLQHMESFGQVGLVEVFLRESWWWKTEEEKNLLLPLLRESRGRKKVIVPFKTAPFWSPFFSFF